MARDTGLTPDAPLLRAYAKVESMTIAELNNFVITAPSQVICSNKDTEIMYRGFL